MEKTRVKKGRNFKKTKRIKLKGNFLIPPRPETHHTGLTDRTASLQNLYNQIFKI